MMNDASCETGTHFSIDENTYLKWNATRLNGLDFNDYFEFRRSKNTRSSQPSNKIQTKLAKVNSFKYYFFVRIVKDWNSLPNHLFTDEIVIRI